MRAPELVLQEVGEAVPLALWEACEALATQGEKVYWREKRPVPLSELVEVGGVGTAVGVAVAVTVEEGDS